MKGSPRILSLGINTTHAFTPSNSVVRQTQAHPESEGCRYTPKSPCVSHCQFSRRIVTSLFTDCVTLKSQTYPSSRSNFRGICYGQLCVDGGRLTRATCLDNRSSCDARGVGGIFYHRYQSGHRRQDQQAQDDFAINADHVLVVYDVMLTWERRKSRTPDGNKTCLHHFCADSCVLWQTLAGRLPFPRSANSSWTQSIKIRRHTRQWSDHGIGVLGYKKVAFPD